MKKKIIILILLTNALSATNHNIHHDTHLIAIPERVSFEGSFFAKLDGVYGLVDGESIKDCFETARIISQIIFGVIDPVSKKKVGIIPFEGQKYSFKEILLMEDDLIKKGFKSNDPEYEIIHKLLKAVKEFFKKTVGPLLEKTKKPMVKSMNLKLINLWLEHSKRKDSIINLFGDDIAEMKALEEANARAFYTFLNDLKFFLKDLMSSAPKACLQYKKEFLSPSNHAKFDAFLNS